MKGTHPVGFGILGPLSVATRDKDFTPTAPKVRQVLAFLLVRRNQLIQVSEFVDELWGNLPPDSAMTTLQTYIYKIRKDLLDPSRLARLHTRPCGYLLEVENTDVDVVHFEHLARQGRLALESGDAARASELLTEALGVWRGNALIGVTAGEIVSAHITRLEEDRLRTLELRIEADIRLGRFQELISELRVLTSTYPLHERFYRDLMTALDRCGRRYEALWVYRRLRELLIDELGFEPSGATQQLHQSLLSADTPEPTAIDTTEPATGPATEHATGHRAAGPGVTRTRQQAMVIVPAQLPPDISDFTGRADQLARVRAALAADNEGATTARAVSLCGMAGIGKTTLALHAAHLDRGRFPDGQLYANLRGASTSPTTQADVLACFLRALGVPERDVPPSTEERSNLFRTWSSGRKLLIVLDDALRASQVVQLLPASPQSAVVITSRWGLQSLPGVRIVKLDVMTASESTALLGNVIGEGRVAAEREQAERIVDLCGHLPLAVRCIGARLAAAPTWPLRKIAMMLGSAPAFLDELRFAEFDVRACYDDVYLRLDPQDRSALRLLSLLPPPPFTASKAAGLLGTTPDAAEALLGRLVTYHLVNARAGRDERGTQYSLHKVIRLYARERLHREYIEPECSVGQGGRETVAG